MKKAISILTLLAVSVLAACGTATEPPTELTTPAATTAITQPQRRRQLWN